MPPCGIVSIYSRFDTRKVDKMEVNNWFGSRKMVTQTNETVKAFKHLLCLYANAISKYFGLDSADSAVDLISAARGSNLKKGDILLVDWFEGKALPIIHKYLSQSLPVSNFLVSQLEYEYHILEQEMGMLYPEDLRACLVDIINDLPDRINDAKARDNTSSDSVIYTHLDSYKPQTFLQSYNNVEHPIISLSYSFWTIEGMDGLLSNNKGSADKAGPLLFDF